MELQVGDYVELKGYEGAYEPSRPRGTISKIKSRFRDGVPYYVFINFDKNVRFSAGGGPPERDFGYFTEESFRLIRREWCPACETSPIALDDYLCSECRYG